MKERLSILQNSMRLGWFFKYKPEKNPYMYKYFRKYSDIWNKTYLGHNFLRLSMYIENMKML